MSTRMTFAALSTITVESTGAVISACWRNREKS